MRYISIARFSIVLISFEIKPLCLFWRFAICTFIRTPSEIKIIVALDVVIGSLPAVMVELESDYAASSIAWQS